MTTYRVEIDGETVWTDETDGYQGAQHFGDYLKRPAETAGDAPHNAAVYLYVDDVLIGVQRAHGDEADTLAAAAADARTAGDEHLAATYDAEAATARLAALNVSKES